MINLSMSREEFIAKHLYEMPDPGFFLEDTRITLTNPKPPSVNGETTLGYIRGNEHGKPHIGPFGSCGPPSKEN